MKSGKQAPKISVIGIGNTLMGDDGVGVEVARGLLSHISPGDTESNVDIIIGNTAGLGLLKHFRESETVIVVDAINVAGAEPGSIFRFDPDEVGITSLRSNNIHGMGISYLVMNARLMGSDPDVIVYGIQVGDIRPNDGVLTPSVGAAADRVRELIAEELHCLANTAPVS